jgi:hypothetical protein
MLKKWVLLLCAGGLTIACYNPPRNCEDFKVGSFRYTDIIDGKEQTTTFVRNTEIEIGTFEGRVDTSSIRWINDCEYVLRNLNPKSREEEKAILIKILSTTDSSYTFEFGQVGSANKSKGTAIKMN